MKNKQLQECKNECSMHVKTLCIRNVINDNLCFLPFLTHCFTVSTSIGDKNNSFTSSGWKFLNQK